MGPTLTGTDTDMSGAVVNAVELDIRTSAVASALYAFDCSVRELLTGDLRRIQIRAAYQRSHNPEVVAANAFGERAEFPMLGALKMGILRHKRGRSDALEEQLRIRVAIQIQRCTGRKELLMFFSAFLKDFMGWGSLSCVAIASSAPKRMRFQSSSPRELMRTNEFGWRSDLRNWRKPMTSGSFP
jgi:hypothetical protein